VLVPKCSFCGKDKNEVDRIVTSNLASICSDCVQLSQEAIDEALLEQSLSTLETAPEVARSLSGKSEDALCIAIKRIRREIVAVLKPHLKSLNSLERLLDKGNY